MRCLAALRQSLRSLNPFPKYFPTSSTAPGKPCAYTYMAPLFVRLMSFTASRLARPVLARTRRANQNSSEQGVASEKATDLRRKTRSQAQSQAHAKQRQAARAKAASVKQAMAEHLRLDEEVNKLERRLEGIEREFRQLLGSVRVKPMGKDRFYNRIWWFDGMGSASLLGSGGIVQYGTGRLFIQSPSVFDQEILDRREEGVVRARR
jgi:hypothetical protein